MATESCPKRDGAKDSSTVSRKAKMENVRQVHDEGIPKVRSKVTIFLQRRCEIGRAACETECLHRRPFAISGHRGKLWGFEQRERSASCGKTWSSTDSSIEPRTRGHKKVHYFFVGSGGCEKRTSGVVVNESSATCRGFAGFGCNYCNDRSAATDPSSNQNFCLRRHSCAFCTADFN